MDYKNDELAHLIANQSLIIKPKTQIYIKYKSDDSIHFIKTLIHELSKKGGICFPTRFNKELEDYLLSTINEDSIDLMLEKTEFENKKYDVFISVGSNDEFTKTKKNNQSLIDEYKRRKMQLEKYKEGKQWLILNYPSIVDAAALDMDYEEYYKYAMDAMTYDFSLNIDSINELNHMMKDARNIRIIGDNVDLSFSKDNIDAVSLLGNINLPDGEIYTSPIRNSVNGYIKYNVPSPKNSFIFEDIYLVFKDGRVVDFDVKDHKDEFEKIINIDEGSRYIGEFAFGFNPMINRPMYDILYDEKLCGSFHMALGNAYKNAYNGNNSALHWDMIYLNKEGNYCDVYFDDVLVSSGGEFVPKRIRGLNK